MSDLKRRQFLQAAGLGTAAIMAGGVAANDEIVVGVIGAGGQGRAHLDSYSSLPNVEVDVKLPDDRSAGVRPHQLNFVEAIRDGRALHADARTGHLSSTLPHLANLACRAGRSFQFDPDHERIVGDDEAGQLLRRTYRDGHWATPVYT